MESARLSENSYVIRLEPEEEVVQSVTRFCEENEIMNAAIWAIGSIENPTLAHYRMDRKKYSEKNFEGVFEIISLIGNVGVLEGKPLVHLHITVSDEEMKAFAGHLVRGKCSATVEVIIEKFDSKHEKRFDENIGLKIWNLQKTS